MPILEKLQPQAVFAHFEQLCAIPHGSGNTKAISDYLVRFAAARGLRHIQDAHNNVIIFCPGTPGYEAAAPVILQGHMDMVCETAPDCTKDLTREGLDLFVDGDTIGARYDPRRGRRHRRCDGACHSGRGRHPASAARGSAHGR